MGIVAALGEKSGLGALDQIYHSLTNAQTRQNVTRNVLRGVVQTESDGALNYALTLESDPHHSIVSDIASVWATSDPRSALAAALGIKKVCTQSSLGNGGQSRDT